MNQNERTNLTKMTVDAYIKGKITLQIAQSQLLDLESQRDIFFKNYTKDNPQGTWQDLQKVSNDYSKTTDYHAVKQQLTHIINVLRNYSVNVGDGVTYYAYSDRDPHTVIARTKSTLTIQEDKCDKDPNWKAQWVPGGFSAVCTNIESQKWIITPDTNGKVMKVYWSNANGNWKCKGANVYEGRYKYYDYNF
jgi:hypothetical protein